MRLRERTHALLVHVLPKVGDALCAREVDEISSLPSSLLEPRSTDTHREREARRTKAMSAPSNARLAPSRLSAESVTETTSAPCSASFFAAGLDASRVRARRRYGRSDSARKRRTLPPWLPVAPTMATSGADESWVMVMLEERAVGIVQSIGTKQEGIARGRGRASTTSRATRAGRAGKPR